VVSPTPIHGQWLGELQQHSGLRVEVYYGLTWHRTAGTGPSRNRQVRCAGACGRPEMALGRKAQAQRKTLP
jgi:hypothetical protein